MSGLDISFRWYCRQINPWVDCLNWGLWVANGMPEDVAIALIGLGK